MAEVPVVVARADLQRRVAEWPDAAGDTSWALCFASVVPDAGELAALREAARLCDRVVLARLTPDRVLPPTYARVAAEAGADVLWCPREVAGHVRLDVGVDGVDGVTATLLVQAVTTVLPNLVVAPRGNLPLVRSLRNVLHGLGDMFVLRVV